MKNTKQTVQDIIDYLENLQYKEYLDLDVIQKIISDLRMRYIDDNNK